MSVMKALTMIWILSEDREVNDGTDQGSFILMRFGVLELLLTSIFGICLIAGFLLKKETKKNASVS